MFLKNFDKKNILIALLLMIIVSPYISVVVSTPSWAKPGVYFTYYIVGKMEASPPPQKGMEHYVVTGHGQFFGLKVNESGMEGYYVLLDLNDTKNYFTRILGMPGYKINSFVNWSTSYNNHQFNIYVDPKTIPSIQKEYENITTMDEYVYYTRIRSLYDKNTGILLEYHYVTEANNTVKNERYVYELHYKLIDTNVEELYNIIGKTKTTEHTTTTTSYSENNVDKTTFQNNEKYSKYPIEYVAYIIGFILIGVLVYYILSSRK